jgi:colanic acid/amylovoran biosynthesis glycosyltransferase
MEGQVLALQEAQAMGVPVIGTYHDGIPEGINEKVTGRLVPERDVTALTEAINFFYDTPSAVGEYSRSARDYIEAHFNNESLIQEQINIYRSLL